RAPDGRARAGQHEPQHRGAAHGRRPAGRPGVLRSAPDRRPRAGPLRGAPERPLPGAGGGVAAMRPPRFDVVIPTLGRPSLAALLQALGRARGPRPGAVVVVDDRPRPRGALLPGLRPAPRDRLALIAGRGAGPAAARNAGWRASRAEWVAFLDDDVVPAPDWLEQLAADLAWLDRDVAGSQGRVRVERPRGRRPTDWERNVLALEGARWITADMAYRRAVLEALGGFDERFRF